jgi:thiol-disulfide isomerase/thioredoxin
VNNLKELENSEPLGEIIREINTAHQGKVLYIDVWAAWCQACLNTFPSSKRLSDELKDVNVVQIYLCVQSAEENWREVSEKFTASP